MKNKTLAITRSCIPYFKELRILTGSVTATILMQQLDYWFSKQDGEPFYKFKAPCENEYYKSGDSFTEELGFSIEEFTNAFAKIGFSYKSKTEFENATDKFQGMFYCSYFDRKEGLTFYFRNHELLDAKLNELFTVKRESPFTENDKASLQKPTKPVSSIYITENYNSRIQQDIQKTNKKEIPVVKESLTTQSVEVEVVEKAKRFQKPTVAEILEYANNLCKKENIKLANLTIEMQNLFDFYEQKDWKVGNTKMKEWKLAVNRWVRGNAVKEQAKQPKTEAQKFLINTENRKAVVDTEAVKKQEEVLREYAKVKTLEPEFMENFKKVLKNYFGGSFTSTIDNLKIKSINQNEIVFMLPNQAYVDIMQRNKQKFEGILKREIEGFYKKAFTGSVKLVAWKN